MKPTLYKIGEGEWRWLSKDMQEIILAYQEENKRLEEENKKLKNKIKKWKNIREIIADCVMIAFFCFMGAGMLCMLFQMITDVIMGFQFVRYV